MFFKMNILNEYLPKDLVYIIYDYAKDRTNYEKVLHDLNLVILDCREWCTGCDELTFIRTFTTDFYNIRPRILGSDCACVGKR